MADFFLQPVSVGNSHNAKVMLFVQSQDDDPTATAIGKCRQRLIKPLRGAFVSGLYFYVVQFAFVLLDFKDKFK